MMRTHSQSSNEDEPQSRKQPSHTSVDFISQSSSQSLNVSLSSDQSTNRTENQPRGVVSLFTYPFLLPLVVEHLCDRDVVARLLSVNKAIRTVIPKYVFKELVSADKALTIINASRDITFSVSRVSSCPQAVSSIDGLILVHRENSTPLQEVHFTLFPRIEFDVIVPYFVTHVGCFNMLNPAGTRLPAGSIPKNVVDLDLRRCVPVVGSIPPSVKRLSMSMPLTDFDPVVIPSTVTDLKLEFLNAGEIRFVFPTSLRSLLLRKIKVPFAPDVLPSSLRELECHSELLSKLEAGAIPDSVKKMKIEWDIHYVPKADVLPDSVTHMEMSITRSADANRHPIPQWPMPASLTRLEMYLPDSARIASGIVPATVTHFKCNNVVESGALPNSITHLEICLTEADTVVGIIPRSVTHLNLMNVRLEQLAILTPGIIPSSVTHLKFCCNSAQNLVPGIIPDSVTHLTFDDSFDRLIPQGVIPQSVTHLALGKWFRQILTSSSLPRALTHLAFGYYFKQPIGLSVMPPSVKHLIFDGYFDCVSSRDALSAVTHLTINDSDQNLDHNTLRRSLTHLDVPIRYLSNGKLQLPAHVTHLSYQPLPSNKHPEFRLNYWHFDLVNSL